MQRSKTDWSGNTYGFITEMLLIIEACIMLIIHNSTCIPSTLAAIVPTAGPGPPSQAPFICFARSHPNSSSEISKGRLCWMGNTLPASVGQCWVNMSPVPCPHLTLIAQVSRVTRNVYSRPDTHSVTSILARAPGILCPGYFYKASLLSDKRDTGDFSTSPNKLNWHRSCLLLGGPIEISSDIWMQTAITVSSQAIVVSKLCFVPVRAQDVGRAGRSHVGDKI